MLLQKILTGSFLICTGFLLVSCYKDYKPEFFNGEWLSDSLVTKDNDHWREFLHFENSHAARTTYWGKKYLLNKDLQLKGLEMYDRDKALFQIKVLDSNKIIVEGKDYYGSFFRNDFQSDDMKKEVSMAEETEKQRKKLLGKWKAVDFKTIPLSDSPENKIMAGYLQDEEIVNIRLREISSLNFNYNTFSIYNAAKTSLFEYSAKPNKITFNSGDAIYSFKYYFQKERLIIEYQKTMGFLHILTFEKAQ